MGGVIRGHKRGHHGSALSRQGFTLVEVLLATVILGMAVTFIFRGLFRSADAVDIARVHLALKNVMQNDIAQSKIALTNGQLAVPFSYSESRKLFGRDYGYTLDANRHGSIPRLYEIVVRYTWQTGRRVSQIIKRVYWPKR